MQLLPELSVVLSVNPDLHAHTYVPGGELIHRALMSHVFNVESEHSLISETTML